MKFRVQTSKFALLVLGTLVMIVGMGTFSTIAIAQTPNTVEQATPPPTSLDSSAGVEVISHTMPHSERQTFDAVMAEASVIARSLINQSFRANLSTNQVSLTVLGSRHGDVVPLLMVRVNREDWQTSPRVEQWSRNLSSSAMRLLAYRSAHSSAYSSPSRSSRSSSGRSFVPISTPTGTRQDYVIPGASLEESDPGYR